MNPYKRILLTRMKFIGDVVLTTPIIRTLREAYPEAHIAYLGDKKAVSLLEHNPYLDEIISFDFSNSSFLYQAKMLYTLYAKKFDLVIDLFSNPRSALLSFATRAKVRVGGDVRGRGKLYTIRIQDDSSLKSAIDFHYQSLQAIGVAPKYFETQIFLTEDEKKEARQFLHDLGVDVNAPIVILHPGATWSNKIWLKEHFAELITLLLEQTNVEIILSPGPHDKDLMDFLMKERTQRVHLLPLLPVRKLAGILSQCAVFVSNDCGPMHIGVAVGTKTLGIFGPEPIEIWFPYDTTKGHLSFFQKLSCSPCRTTQCFRTGDEYLECMKLISARTVFDAVKERL